MKEALLLSLVLFQRSCLQMIILSGAIQPVHTGSFQFAQTGS